MLIVLQLEQEMDLVLKRSNGFHSFKSEWKDKWCDAILKYGKKCKKKDIKAIIASLDANDDDGKN